MGVTGLLQQLKEIQQKRNLSHYKGQTLAVDTYGWLHRGLISCAQDLCLDNPTKGYITSVMKKVDMLRYFGVEPFMVFDGSLLPTKEGTNAERAAKREKAREAAQAYLARGDKKSAWKEFMKAASVTAEMAKSVMAELDRHKVQYVVAPYEADPQMVYLEKIGVVDGILSEDSDLLIFGCNRLITKLNDYGECIEINRANFGKIKRPNLLALTDLQWRSVAILSGCDYTKGIPGVGLKTAFNYILRLGDLERVVAFLQLEKKEVPELFLQEAYLADLAFQFQKVFNPKEKVLATLNEYPTPNELPMDLVETCCGRTMDHTIHVSICTGKIHPASHQPLLSREQCLASGVSSSKSTYTASMAVSSSDTAVTTAKTIESFFKVEKMTKSTSEKRATPKTETKLSPIAKKLKRVSPIASKGKSKFFSAPKLSPKHYSSTEAESEIPESSPVRPDEKPDSQYLTDIDDDDEKDTSRNNSIFQNSMARPPLVSSTKSLTMGAATDDDAEQDDGYEDDFEESPVKMKKVGASLRERFLLIEGGLLQKDASSKFKVLDSESSLGPPTPDETSLRLLSQQSQQKSLQREEYYLSESEPEPEKKPLTTKGLLQKFAFSGK